MLHLIEETTVFDFLSCVKFRASNFSVCIKFNFNERILQSVYTTNEILGFPRKFSFKNVDYVKLTNIQKNRKTFKCGEFR